MYTTIYVINHVATLFVFIEACLSSVISALKAMGLSKEEMPIELLVSLFIKPTVIFCFCFPHDTQQVPMGITRIFFKKIVTSFYTM